MIARTVEGEWVGPFLLGRNILADQGLSGGAFGSVYEALGPHGKKVVAKVGRDRGGGASNTYSEFHHPDVVSMRHSGDGQWFHATLSADDVDQVLRGEARVLERAGGVLLPRPFGVFDNSEGRPVLVMERIEGHRPSSIEDITRVLMSLSAASSARYLDYHGDLKPEHIFINDRVRLVDPAPRLDQRGEIRAFTPEYNPYGLIGPVADVFAVAVLLYEVLAVSDPFYSGHRRLSVADVPVELPPPVARGRSGVPAQLGSFVDDVLRSDPGRLPDWAQGYSTALDRFVSS